MLRLYILSSLLFVSLSAMVKHTGHDLITAIRSHDLANAQEYLSEIEDINYQDPVMGNTVLHELWALGDEGASLRALIQETYGPILRSDIKNNAGLSPEQMAPSSYFSLLPSPSGMFASAVGVFSSSASAAYSALPSPSGIYTAAACAASSTASTAYEAVDGARNRYIQLSQLRSEITAPDVHSTHSAQVTSMVPAGEQMFLKDRAAQVHVAIEQFLGEPVDEHCVPSIGLACSGGGVRALLESVGWLSGAQDSRLYNCLTHMSGLSGSTWAINSYLASGMSMADYKEHLKNRLAVSLTDHATALTSDDLRDVVIALGRLYYNGRRMTVVDIYGILLAQILLKGLVPNPYEVPLSALTAHLGNHPFPLSTAVVGGEISSSGFKHHPSYEFSPVSAGSFELKSHVPIWALGRVFNEGVSQTITPRDLDQPELYTAAAVTASAVTFLPPLLSIPVALGALATKIYLTGIPYGPYYGKELPLSFFLGVCGSAFSANMYNIIRELYLRLAPTSCPTEPHSVAGQTEGLKALALNLMKRSGIDLPQHPHLDDPHFGAASVPYPASMLPQAPFSAMAELPLVDAGFEMLHGNRLNIGIVPLLYRNSDVIIICDSSQDLKDAPSLRAAEELARALNLPFPSIAGVESHRHIQLFADEANLDAPLVLYMPGIAHPGFNSAFDPQTAPWADTTNFTYTPEQSTQLMDLISHTVKNAETVEVIKRTIRLAIERKKKRAAQKATVLGRLSSWWQGK